MSSDSVGTVVVGGSQAGLAVGYHLGRRGLPCVILDQNERIGGAWRKRWDSLRLFTPVRYCHLPGMPFPGPALHYQVRDGGVLVVGAGNSGAEIAIELATDHRTWLAGPDTGQEPTRAGTLPDRLGACAGRTSRPRASNECRG